MEKNSTPAVSRVEKGEGQGVLQLEVGVTVPSRDTIDKNGKKKKVYSSCCQPPVSRLLSGC